MKRIFILSLLLTLSLAAFPQAAEQVVRSYISTLNDFLLSPNTFSKRSAFENSLQNCLIQDGIYIKYKGNVSIDDCKGSDYAGIIANAINDNQRYSYAKVEIARSLQTTGSGSSYEVTAYLRYTGAIEMRTVTVFHIRSNKISAMTNDYIKTKEWNAGDTPEPTVPFTITSCTVSNVDYDGNSLPMDATHTQYLTPEIKYTCNTSGNYDIYVKFYDASGGMKIESWSPSGYTQVNNVIMSSGSGSKKLKGYGGTDSGNWRAGNYRYEFYYNGTLLYTHRFSVPEGQQQPSQQPSSSSGIHQYVDLGLPSGTLWATTNIGAANPWDYGDYFAWGETTTKSKYDWSTYKYANGASNKLTKYCNRSDYGNNGYTDSRTTLERSDDAAYQNWGSDWCMPTQAQFQELLDNCTNEWTTNYQGKGVAGRIFKSKKNGNTIFFPAAGYKGSDGKLSLAGSNGYYWSSSLDAAYPFLGRRLYFGSGYVYALRDYRGCGDSVRAVRFKN